MQQGGGGGGKWGEGQAVWSKGQEMGVKLLDLNCLPHTAGCLSATAFPDAAMGEEANLT